VLVRWLFQRNIDVFSFQVGAGTKLTEIRISDYQSSDAIAVLGINNDNFFPFDPSTFNNTLTLVQLQQIIGVAQFGTGWANTVNSGARDLLASVDPNLTNANLIGSRTSGFKSFETYGPNDKFDEVGPGTYTIYMQQTGDNTQYQLDLTVVSTIPEPSSFALVGLFAASALARRRR
jgi:PEP-CTERM motif